MFGPVKRFLRPEIRFVLLAVTLASGRAGADTVTLTGKPPFDSVEVTGLRDGRLIFRGVSQQFLRIPLGRVDWVALDELPALGAERPASPDAALERIAAAAPHVSQPWHPLLLSVLRARELDQSGRFDEALEAFADLLRGGAVAGEELAPRRLPAPGDERIDRALVALRELERAMPESRAALRGLRLELRLLQDEDLAREFTPPSVAAPVDEPATAASAPAGGARRLFGSGARPVTTTRGEPARLRANTPLPAVLAEHLSTDPARVARIARRGSAYATETDAARLRLLLGRALLAAGDAAGAASELLALVPTAKDPEIVAGAVYDVPRALRQLGRPDAADAWLHDLLGTELDPRVRAAAEQALKDATP